MTISLIAAQTSSGGAESQFDNPAPATFLSQPVQVGDLIYVNMVNFDSASVPTLTDNLGNHYGSPNNSPLIQLTGGTTRWCGFAYAISSGSAANLTVSGTAGTQRINLEVMQFRSTNHSFTLNSWTGSNVSGSAQAPSNMNVGPVTTTQSSAVIIEGMWTNAGATLNGGASGYISDPALIIGAVPSLGSSAYLIVSQSSTYTPGLSFAGGAADIGGMAAAWAEAAGVTSTNIFVSGTFLSWIDTTGVIHTALGGISTVSAGLTPGQMIVANSNFVYCDANSNTRVLSGANQGASSYTPGSVRIVGTKFRWTGTNGNEYAEMDTSS